MKKYIYILLLMSCNLFCQNDQLRIEIKRHIRRCKNKGFKAAVRLNGTSDIDWNIHGLYEEFKQVKFYG